MRARGLGLLLVALLCAGVAARVAVAAPAYKIVVHPGNPATSAERRFVADAFLKRTTRWGSGEPIRPVDQTASSATRRAFSEDLLGRSVDAIKNFWQQTIFSGRDVPPPEVDGDDEVIRFVMKYPGAIGYVSAGAGIGGAKLLQVR